MTHITNWPRELNWPFSELMFTGHGGEREFWGHLLSCEPCKQSFQHRFDDYDLEDELFWMQVQEYLSGVHLHLDRISQTIRLEADHDLIDAPSEEISNEVWEKKKEIDYHLMICSRCSRIYFEIYERLRQNDTNVRVAHEKWYGLHTKNSGDSGVPNY